MSDESLPAIDYPVLYVFRAIGRNVPDIRDHVRRIVQSVVGLIPDDAVTERPSANGKYTAVHVSCLLGSEEQRREVYAKLKADPQVVFLL